MFFTSMKFAVMIVKNVNNRWDNTMKSESISDYKQTINKIVELKTLSEVVFRIPIKEGKWSIREIIGHLFYWDKFILEKHLPHMNDGARLIAFPDLDTYNQEAIQYISRFKNTAALIDEFKRTRQTLLKEIEKKDKTIQFTVDADIGIYTIERYMDIFADHDQHHLNQINELVKQWI